MAERGEGMAEVVNLNHFRKAKKKADKDTQTASNRVRHGRRKGDRQRQDMEESRRQRNLSGHAKDRPAQNSDDQSKDDPN